MEVTNDDLHLITAGRDGCIIIYEIKDKEARGGLRRNEGYPDFSDEVLVTKEEIQGIEAELKNKMRDLSDERQVTENGPNTETDEAQIK